MCVYISTFTHVQIQVLHSVELLDYLLLRVVLRLVIFSVLLHVAPILHDHEAAVSRAAQQVADRLVVPHAAEYLQYLLTVHHLQHVSQGSAVVLTDVLVLAEDGKYQGRFLIQQRLQVSAPTDIVTLFRRLPRRQGLRVGFTQQRVLARRLYRDAVLLAFLLFLLNLFLVRGTMALPAFFRRHDVLVLSIQRRVRHRYRLEGLRHVRMRLFVLAFLLLALLCFLLLLVAVVLGRKILKTLEAVGDVFQTGQTSLLYRAGDRRCFELRLLAFHLLLNCKHDFK